MSGRIITNHLQYIADIMAFTEKQILAHTGLEIKLSMSYEEKMKGYLSSPKEMLIAMLDALDLTIDDVRKRTKKENIVLARHACAHLLSKHFVKVGPSRIGDLFDQHHTAISNAIKMAEHKIERKDEDFMSVYAPASVAAANYISKVKGEGNAT